MKVKKNIKPINSPVVLSTTFSQDVPSQWGYSRVDDPTRLALERELADLEKANHALAFSSGSSAIACLFMLLKAGDHILCHREIYEGTRRILDKILKKFGLEFDLIDLKKIDEVKNKIRPSTKMIFFENITNPNLDVINVKNITELAKKNNILVAVDNTICTPIFQKPLLEEADLVVHSLTKFISGHHDVLGGSIMTNNIDLFERLKFNQQTLGWVLSPFDCHLVSRGIKTLDIRMKKQTDSAFKIFNFLKNHKKIKKTNFPGVSGIISFTIGGKNTAKMFLKRLKSIKIAQSFGGVESTILHPGSMMVLSSKIDDNFFRLSIGVEDPDLLINDLKEALK